MPKEWVIHEYNGFEGLSLQECDLEEPGPTEVRLRVEAFALNWGDNDLMFDRYSFSFSSMPARIGIEAAGIVDKVGADVSDISVGDRYCTLPYFYDRRGASADTMIIDQAYVTKSPDGLTAVEAASIWMQFLTAYYPIVELAEARAGRTILVPAGTSTAGDAAIQIAKLKGATVVSTTRSNKNVQILRDAGADYVFVDDGGDIEKFLLEVTHGKGIDASFDPVGGDFMDRYASAMAKNGIMMLYGGLAGSYSSPPFLAMIQKSLWYHTYSVFNYVEDPQTCSRGKKFVYEAFANGQLTPNVDRVFPMGEYVEAWKYLRGDRKSYGKVLVKTGAT